VTVSVPQQVTVNVPQQALLFQQAPPQAAPLNLLSAAPPQPPAAAPPQPVVYAMPSQPVAAAPPQPMMYAMPVAQPVVAAAPAQPVMLAAPAQPAGLSLPGLNIPGANLNLRSPGMVDRFVGRIGKKLRERSYPRVAIDIESAEAAAQANEVEVVVERQAPRHYTINQGPPKHVHQYEQPEPPPPPPNYGPLPSPQGPPPAYPSPQR
jgi:hypothetical protein